MADTKKKPKGSERPTRAPEKKRSPRKPAEKRERRMPGIDPGVAPGITG